MAVRDKSDIARLFDRKPDGSDCEKALRSAELVQTLLAVAGLIAILLGTAARGGMAIVAAVAQAVIVFLYARQMNVVSSRRVAFRQRAHDESLVLVSDILRRNVDAQGRSAAERTGRTPGTP